MAMLLPLLALQGGDSAVTQVAPSLGAVRTTAGLCHILMLYYYFLLI